ncbi:MAG TPA: hypothetical protein VJR25_14810 [Microbacterium sp.]|uniref:hypothetical protein n=1 Tax=Microbacterium sp. TaxID=51671 RepID=UPI002B478C8D|nr:hypothetical protein [Microbacterium sp.]HKT58031.1 hypothetical protein [Microbacterium sp.]
MFAVDSTGSPVTAQTTTGSVPVIIGDPTVESELTVDPGTWPDGTSFSYQWYQDGVARVGATAPIYYVSSWDGGARISVAVTGVSPDGSSETRESAPTLGVIYGWALVNGDPRVGSTLTVDPGDWEPATTTLTYQWTADGTPIPGATGTSLALTPDLESKLVGVVVTGAQDGFFTRTQVVNKSRVMLVGKPRISGTPDVGQALTVDPGTWSAGVNLKITWSGWGGNFGYGPIVFVTPQQAGHPIKVTVTGIGDGMTTESASTTTDDPLLDGSAAVGVPLTIEPGHWAAGTALSYRWFADGVAIDAADQAQFTPTSAQVNQHITATVTGVLPGGSAQTRMTVPSSPVMNTSVPTITGNMAVGSTLTVHPGSWPVGAQLTYQWIVDGMRYYGATGSTFVVPSGFPDRRMAVEVTASSPGYDTVSRSSAPTAPILVPGLVSLYGDFELYHWIGVDVAYWRTGTASAYQWLRNGVAIPGATKSVYWETAVDEGKTLSARVVLKVPEYGTITRTLASLGRITSAPLPSFTGAAAVGSTLHAAPGTWKKGTSLRYQWYEDEFVILGATGTSYTLRAAQTGKRISVAVTGRTPGYATVTNFSFASARVATASTPTVSGTPKVAAKLVAKPGAWTSGTTFSYLWYANGKAISRATKSVFVPTWTQWGKKITVRVTGHKWGYATVSRTSKSTAAVW